MWLCGSAVTADVAASDVGFCFSRIRRAWRVNCASKVALRSPTFRVSLFNRGEPKPVVHYELSIAPCPSPCFQAPRARPHRRDLSTDPRPSKNLPLPRRGGQAPSGKGERHAQNKLDLIELIIDRFHGSMPSILARRFLTSNRSANQSSEQLTAVSGDGLSVVQSQMKPAIFFLLGSHAFITP